MSERDDLQVVLLGRQPLGAVPIWEVEFQAWNAVTRHPVIFGAEFVKLTASEQDRALHVNAEEIIPLACKWHYAALTIPGPYWELAPGEPAFYWLPPESRIKQAKLFKKVAGDRIMLVGTSGGVLGMPSSKNYLNFCYTLHDSPEKIDELARQYLEGGKDAVMKLRESGIEIMLCPSDIADNSGPFYNPSQMQRFILPFLTQWASAVKSAGAYSIFHSDGNLMPCLDDLCRCGLHAIQAIDPTAGMDMLKAKEIVAGRLCLAGNIDCNKLLLENAQAIYSATEKLLTACKRGGGLILGCSNAVVAQTPIENYYAILDAWRDHGQYHGELNAKPT